MQRPARSSGGGDFGGFRSDSPSAAPRCGFTDLGPHIHETTAIPNSEFSIFDPPGIVRISCAHFLQITFGLSKEMPPKEKIGAIDSHPPHIFFTVVTAHVGGHGLGGPGSDFKGPPFGLFWNLTGFKRRTGDVEASRKGEDRPGGDYDKSKRKRPSHDEPSPAVESAAPDEEDERGPGPECQRWAETLDGPTGPPGEARP